MVQPMTMNPMQAARVDLSGQRVVAISGVSVGSTVVKVLSRVRAVQFPPDGAEGIGGGEAGLGLLVIEKKGAPEHDESLLEEPDEGAKDESIDPAAQNPFLDGDGPVFGGGGEGPGGGGFAAEKDEQPKGASA